ncbi:hypothetical protein ACLOJK_002706 [Asimina triloba]
MPDLSNLLNTSQLLLPPCSPDDICFKDGETKTAEASNGRCRIWDRRLRCLALEKSGSSAEKNGTGVADSRRNHKRWGRGEVAEVERRNKRGMSSKSLEDHVRDWVARKVSSGVPERECRLPFLVNAPKMVECHFCNKPIYPDEEVLCSVRGCGDAYHTRCVQNSPGFSASRNFICPQHVPSPVLIGGKVAALQCRARFGLLWKVILWVFFHLY